MPAVHWTYPRKIIVVILGTAIAAALTLAAVFPAITVMIAYRSLRARVVVTNPRGLIRAT